MQNKKKEGFRRSTNLHVTYRETSEATEASGSAIQPILSLREPPLFPPFSTLVYRSPLRLFSLSSLLSANSQTFDQSTYVYFALDCVFGHSMRKRG